MLKHSLINKLLISIFAIATLGSCDKEDFSSSYANFLIFYPGEEDEIKAALINLTDDTDILLTSGTYSFDNLSIQGPLNKIMIRGEGPSKTIIDFSSQQGGGEGFRIDDVNNLVVRDIRLQESTGDLLKVVNGIGVDFINVHTVWEGTPDETNGGYGIYPVLCEDVLIEECYVRGASDAGVYVGQTKGAVVRFSKAEYCVAGMEIENTTDAKVYNNECTNNAGGLLVFDLPGLAFQGGNVEVYNNYVHNNNYKNFAPAAMSATGVGNVPPGTGIMVLAMDDVIVRDNTIENNNTMCIGIVSFVFLDESILVTNPEYDPVPENIYIHDNEVSKKNNFPPTVAGHPIATMLVGLHLLMKLDDPANNPTIQEIIYDGITLRPEPDSENPTNICIQEGPDRTFVNVNADMLDFDNLNVDNVSIDISPYDCTIP